MRHFDETVELFTRHGVQLACVDPLLERRLTEELLRCAGSADRIDAHGLSNRTINRRTDQQRRFRRRLCLLLGFV